MKTSSIKLCLMALLSAFVFTACSDDNDSGTGSGLDPNAIISQIDVTFDNTTAGKPLYTFAYDDKNVLTGFTVSRYKYDTSALIYTVTYKLTRNNGNVTINSQRNYSNGEVETEKMQLTIQNNKVTEKTIFEEDESTVQEKIVYTWNSNKLTKLEYIYYDGDDSESETYAFTYSGNNVDHIKWTEIDVTDGRYEKKEVTTYSYDTAKSNSLFAKLPMEFIFAIDEEGGTIAMHLSENETTKSVCDYESISYEEGKGEPFAQMGFRDTNDFTYTYDSKNRVISQTVQSKTYEKDFDKNNYIIEEDESTQEKWLVTYK